MLTTIITAVILLASVLLVFVVYIQNPKGGGLAAGFTGANQIGGVKRTTDFLEKATWSLATAFIVLCILSNFVIGPETQGGSVIQQNADTGQVQAPALPTPDDAAPADAGAAAGEGTDEGGDQ